MIKIHIHLGIVVYDKQMQALSEDDVTAGCSVGRAIMDQVLLILDVAFSSVLRDVRNIVLPVRSHSDKSRRVLVESANRSSTVCDTQLGKTPFRFKVLWQ
jgi:hypothetical protein